jgi:hypothetical protein
MTAMIEADIAAFGAAVTDLLTKVTISASNHNLYYNETPLLNS